MTEKMKYDDTNQSSWVIYTEQKYKCNNFCLLPIQFFYVQKRPRSLNYCSQI